MKTLSLLIEEALERIQKDITRIEVWNGYANDITLKHFEDIKTELTNIVKESFKNTRVEEYDTKSLEKYAGGDLSLILKYYNQAIKDLKDKENQFLNN